MSQTALRNLPSIDQFLQRAGVQSLIARAGRDTVRDHLRSVLDAMRRELLQANHSLPVEAAPLADETERRLQAQFNQRELTQTQRVINATGVVLHTNLGRAPLSAAALAAIDQVARGYCNLEYDVSTGKRGKRGTGLAERLSELLGCEAVAIVNNCAAAVLITLNTLGEGGEVIVSRGELVEIGGSFRIPDVIVKSGARLREVGTTNRTWLRDYESAINEHTKVIMRAHPSNYRIIGFTEKPSSAELTQLAQKYQLPFFEDLGSGALIDLAPLGIRDEPSVKESFRAGASVVAFSGDKLLGGPQAGLIAGEKRFIQQIKTNPLMRALRVDKLTYAALEATVAAYLRGDAQTTVPVLAALHADKATLTKRAQAFVRRARKALAKTAPELQPLELKLLDGASMVGGGSAPEQQLPTKLIALRHAHLHANQLEERLRAQQPPIVARIQDEQLIFDLRTVAPHEESELLKAIQSF